MRRARVLGALAAASLLLATSCGGDDDSSESNDTGGTGEGQTNATSGEQAAAPAGAGCEYPSGETKENGGYRFVVVSHGQSADPFWSVVANGVDAAAEDMGVEVDYQAPGTFDMAAMSQLIDAAVASKPDGLIVSIPDAAALKSSIEEAIDAGIPVISMNSGSDVFADLCVLVHVGQTEFEAGQIAGQRMAQNGATKGLCVNQEVGNAALDLRCDGFKDGLGGDVEVVPVELNDPTGAESAVTNALQANQDVDAVLALGPTGAAPTLAALRNSDRLESIELATFDLGSDVLQAIEDGDMAFAIDQAQYLQGYLPVVLMTKYLDTGAIPLGSVDRVIMTGPQIVTADNAADVIQYTDKGIR